MQNLVLSQYKALFNTNFAEARSVSDHCYLKHPPTSLSYLCFKCEKHVIRMKLFNMQYAVSNMLRKLNAFLIKKIRLRNTLKSVPNRYFIWLFSYFF